MQISEKLGKAGREAAMQSKPPLAIEPVEEEKIDPRKAVRLAEEEKIEEVPAGETPEYIKPVDLLPDSEPAEPASEEHRARNPLIDKLAAPKTQAEEPPKELTEEPPKEQNEEGTVQDLEEVALLEEEIEPPKPGMSAGVQRADPEKMMGPLALKHARRGGFIKIPTYRKNEKTGRMEEINVPDPKYYFPVGYDREPGDGYMHYRYYVGCELEESEYIDK